MLVMVALDARLGPRSTREPTDSGGGFDGQLRCASLADLIQLQCGSRARAAVSVRSEERDGHLFFDDGQIIHAIAGGRLGEEAVFEILNWTTGTFGKSAEPWPEQPSVTSNWQYLLLTAAQRRDETQQGFPAVSTSRLMAVKKVLSSLPSPEVGRAAEAAMSLPRPPRKAPATPAQAPVREGPWGVVYSAPTVVRAVRFDESGHTLEMRGDGQQLLGLAVYVRSLAELMGENLGQGGFRAFECRSESTSLVLFADTPGSHIIAETTAMGELRPLYRA